MKTEIDYEAIENSTGKITTGFRCEPELKLELANEATELGIKLSEHLENTLANRHRLKAEIEQLKQTLELRDRTITEVELQLTGKEKLELELTNSRKETQKLKELVAKLTAQNGLFNDKRLNYLFDQLKGKKDKVENAYSGGDFDITYNTPVDVLIALIYSSTLNQ